MALLKAIPPNDVTFIPRISNCEISVLHDALILVITLGQYENDNCNQIEK
jgi:hypothetical protein